MCAYPIDGNMDMLVFLYFCVQLFVITFGHANNFQYELYVHNKTFGNLVDMIDTDSVQKCVALCDDTSMCMSVNFNKESMICKLTDYYPTDDTDVGMTEAGWKVYFRQHFECQNGWAGFRWSCYYFGNSDLSFTDAQTLCENNNASLVNIEDTVENTFVRNHVMGLSAPNHWIGLTDISVEGIWRHYPAGTDATFRGWDGSQPNNGIVSNCAAIFEAFGHRWVDEPCTSKYKPICERLADS